MQNKNHVDWEDRYSIGDDQIDAEHKRLFDLANDVLDIADPKGEAQRIRLALHELYDYMKVHFEHEERYMEEVGYPQLASHRELHRGLTAEMNDILKTSKGYQQLLDRLSQAMREWLVQHIVEEDGKIMSFLSAQAGDGG